MPRKKNPGLKVVKLALRPSQLCLSIFLLQTFNGFPVSNLKSISDPIESSVVTSKYLAENLMTHGSSAWWLEPQIRGWWIMDPLCDNSENGDGTTTEPEG